MSTKVLKAALRPMLRLLGLRPPDYRSRIRHGEVCMDNIELHGLVRAIGSLDRPPACVVEIGSYCGGSTVIIARAAVRRNPDVVVYAVEPFVFDEPRYRGDYERLFDANVSDWRLSQTVVKVRQTSQAAAVTWKREIDFLYVDGDHRYEAVVSDIRAFAPFVRHGGLLAFHDYKLSGKEGVRRAVDELVAPHHARLFQAGSLVCFRIQT